jgi:coenzyme F420 hydrogenase subunit beta
MPSAGPNGVIRNLLVAARSAGLIDGVIMPDMDPWSLKPRTRVATTVEQIVDSLGFQGLWAPVLDALNEAIFGRNLHNLAVVGTPCVAEAVRKIKATETERLGVYRSAIRLVVSDFCVGVTMPGMVAQLLEQTLGITPDMIRQLKAAPAGEALTVVLWDGTEQQAPATDMEPYTRHGCASCDDYLGGWADIAVGPVGAIEGHVTLITRSRVGDQAVDNAVRFKLLEIRDEVNAAALEKASAAKERRERAQAFDELTLLTLDALADPQKRAEARALFGRLYRLPSQTTKKEDAIYAGCSGC